MLVCAIIIRYIISSGYICLQHMCCSRHKCVCNGLVVLCCLAVVCNKFLESLIRHAGCACSLCDGCSKLHHSIDFILIEVVAQAISSLQIQSCSCTIGTTSAILQDSISLSTTGLKTYQRRDVECHVIWAFLVVHCYLAVSDGHNCTL